ncbi:Disaggregatase related repeat protein [Stieleria maiorica]|uniref:Disaggregatase related repeat protein n=1 Tax=Stieleria maiorica TaxID=2795974 RepID=A0A5B9M8G8_9BACT|nr:disaggregatase related repeat-containing protein [Stieleria maiorica]QEF96466.1 Disaggregatase related repeat protein [Stieleria maiorica]
MPLTRHVLLVLAIAFASQARADRSDWVEGSSAQTDGANREHYNRAAILPWKHFMGDWRDATDVAQGDAAYAEVEVIDNDTPKPVRWNVTTLVKQWTAHEFPCQGMFLRVTGDRGRIAFASREHEDASLHPTLQIRGPSGTIKLTAIADTHLTASTYRSQGRARKLRVSAEPEHLLVRFDWSDLDRFGAIDEATLVLHSTEQYGSARIGVFRCRQGHDEPPSPPRLGIAAKYDRDRGIEADPQVVFATGFERDDWREEWTVAEPEDKIDVIAADANFQNFEALQKRALRSRIAKGAFTALNTTYKFEKETGDEPEEIYFRYYLRLADDWNQTLQGGKLPGISGTYGRGGWGGRKSDGVNGWSARGLFRMTVPDGNPLAGTTPVGFYCYHADMNGNYGTNWIWNKDYRGYLETNRWYAIEQHCRLNTPGEIDGVLRAWVDGRLAFEKADVRFRLTDALKIEQIWMNVYHGGKQASPHDQHLFIDNVVIGKDYIGPMMATANNR